MQAVTSDPPPLGQRNLPDIHLVPPPRAAPASDGTSVCLLACLLACLSGLLVWKTEIGGHARVGR